MFLEGDDTEGRLKIQESMKILRWSESRIGQTLGNISAKAGGWQKWRNEENGDDAENRVWAEPAEGGASVGGPTGAAPSSKVKGQTRVEWVYAAPPHRLKPLMLKILCRRGSWWSRRNRRGRVLELESVLWSSHEKKHNNGSRKIHIRQNPVQVQTAAKWGENPSEKKRKLPPDAGVSNMWSTDWKWQRKESDLVLQRKTPPKKHWRY